jgi:putative ABC transport system permease protein
MDGQRSDIPRTIFGEGALIVIVGVGAGLIGSMMLTRFLQTMLFDIEPTDRLAFGALTILLAGVALSASFIPARERAGLIRSWRRAMNNNRQISLFYLLG